METTPRRHQMCFFRRPPDFGWSGHGFKHTPMIGDIISEVILHGGHPDYDIRPFRWSRFREGDLFPSQRGWAARPAAQR